MFDDNKKTSYTATEIGMRGQALYEQQIRQRVEAENRGKFLVLDVTSGEYEIAAEDLTASDRLLMRKPDAVLFGVRIGHHTAYRLAVRGEVTIEAHL